MEGERTRAVSTRRRKDWNSSVIFLLVLCFVETNVAICSSNNYNGGIKAFFYFEICGNIWNSN